MPYVSQERRMDLNPYDYIAGHKQPGTAGELNYVITVLARNFLGENPNYADFNEVIGVLECAKLELYRRMVAPYENKKWSEHGDVY